MSAAPAAIRVATADDMTAVARLLDAFNREYDEPTPQLAWLAQRLRTLTAPGDTAVLLAGTGPDGLAVVRLRPSLWSDGLEAYLAELYVVPSLRGRGLGRALLEAAIALARERGADHMDLGTSEDDVAARALYERLGFTNRERPPDGPVMYVYERALTGEHAPHNAMDDPGEIARFRDRCSVLMGALLDELATTPGRPRTFPEVEDALGWPRRRIASVLGGAPAPHRVRGPAPYRFLGDRASASGRWEIWADDVQARALRAAAR